MKSWRTSVTGLVSILAAIANAASLMLDDNPNTNADWTATIAAITAGLGLLFARDNKVTSEQAKGLPATPSQLRAAGLLLVSCGLLSVVVFSGCRALAPDGVYKGDQVLHNAELATTTSYEVIHTFVSWEYENRAALTVWPEIKTAADAMRKSSPQWFKTAYALRDAYAIAPTDENRAALEKSLSVLRAALSEAAQYMAQAAQPTN